MTKAQLDDFLSVHDLLAFDGLIKLKLKNGLTYEAVWITGLPPLKKSVDGKFGGKPEAEVFYLFDKNEYLVCTVEDLDSVELIQLRYLV